MGNPTSVLRLPSAYAPVSPFFKAPSIPQLLGTWYMTHTSLPFWKDKQNVTITYSELTSHKPSAILIDDLITYQEAPFTASKSTHGTDKPTPGIPGAWDWRGNGWLRLVSNHWEIWDSEN